MKKLLCILFLALYLPSLALASYGDGVMGDIIYGDTSFGGWLFNFSETLTLTDSKAMYPLKPIQNTIGFADTFIRGGGITVADLFHVSDSYYRNIGRKPSDTISLTDVSTKNPTKPINSSIGFVGVIASKRPDKYFFDATTFVDARSKTTVKSLVSDSVSIIDAIFKRPTINRSESVGFVDVEVPGQWNALADVIGYTDSLSFQLSTLKNDAMALLDSCNRTINPGVINWQQSLADVIGLSDSRTKDIGKPLSEGISFVDIYSKTLGKLFSSVIGLADSFGKTSSFYKTFPEIVSFADSRTVAYSKILDNVLALSDSIGFNLPVSNWMINLSDSVSFLDAITKKSMVKNFSESVSFIDVYYKGTLRQLTDNMHLLDLFAYSVMYYRTLNDTLHLIDASSLPVTAKHILKVYFQLKSSIIDFIIRTPSIEFELMEE